MSNYRRIYQGTTWFFTVVAQRRKPVFIESDIRRDFRDAISRCRKQYPFEIDAWVLLPDHMHCIWTMPEQDCDYSRRWSMIKRYCTKLSAQSEIRQKQPYWQKRFWAHCITDEHDLAKHIEYIHFNPVKHRLVDSVRDWEWSTFHRYVSQEKYARDWGSDVEFPAGIGSE